MIVNIFSDDRYSQFLELLLFFDLQSQKLQIQLISNRIMHNSNQQSRILKLCLIGSENVGKSRLAKRFIDNSYAQQYTSTVGAVLLNKNVQSRHTDFQFMIWDISGQPRYSFFFGIYLPTCCCVLVIYDITSRKSYAQSQKLIQTISAKYSHDSIILLIGNKCDLEEEREVTFQEGKDYAKKLGAVFLETSAKDSVNVEKMFTIIISQSNKNKMPLMLNPQNRLKINKK